jgi:uncharacterized protein YecE (DUF72 family)
MARAWIGTSGFDYPHWVGPLYPKDLPQDRRLSFYAQHFDSVELNYTFYRLPGPDVFERWARETPDAFRFVVKGSRYITHVKRLADPKEPIERLFAAAEPMGEKLSCVLWQTPPRWRARPERLADFLAALADHRAARRVRHAFEFRDESWFTEEVYQMLRRADAALVIADSPFELLAPGMASRRLGRPVVEIPLTGSWAYIRRHGPGKLYSGSYPATSVKADAAWIAETLAAGRDAYVFYNNDPGAHAVANASSLAEALSSATRE